MIEWDCDLDFSAELPGPWVGLKRIKRSVQTLVRAPNFRVISPAFQAARWAIYFAYSPEGEAFDQHLFAIRALRQEGFRVLVIVASLREELDDPWHQADALIWKAMPGFDLSGLRIAIRHIAQMAPGADVLWMNDSLFGPLLPLGKIIDRCRWKVTGFTLSFAVEPHLQSYAMYFRGVDSALCRSIERVIYPWVAINAHSAVAYVQETRLSRIISARHPVGALWVPRNREMDLCMAKPFPLIESGFPFLKRSILGKSRLASNDLEAIRILQMHGHPTRDGRLFEGFSMDLIGQTRINPRECTATRPSR